MTRRKWFLEDRSSYWTNVKYNELATLTYVSQDSAINHLLSRGTHKQYSPLGELGFLLLLLDPWKFEFEYSVARLRVHICLNVWAISQEQTTEKQGYVTKLRKLKPTFGISDQSHCSHFGNKPGYKYVKVSYQKVYAEIFGENYPILTSKTP